MVSLCPKLISQNFVMVRALHARPNANKTSKTPPVSRNVFRERYITPLEDDEQDERPYESNELYDEELTPAPNQIEGSAIGKGVGTNHNKYAGSSGESAVKAENIVTFNKDGKLRTMSFCGRYGGTLPNRLKRAADSRSLPSQINALPSVCMRCGRAAPLCPPAGTDSSAGSDYSSLLDDGHLLIVSVAVLFFCCVCLSFGALVAYKMKLFQSGNNRCIKASESTDSHSTPSSYRGPSEDFDLVECMPDTMDAMAVKTVEVSLIKCLSRLGVLGGSRTQTVACG